MRERAVRKLVEDFRKRLGAEKISGLTNKPVTRDLGSEIEALRAQYDRIDETLSALMAHLGLECSLPQRVIYPAPKAKK